MQKNLQIHSICAGKYFCLSSQETFFCRNLKNYKMSFLDQCNVETASRLGIQGLSCSKVVGFEDGIIQKLFKGYIFCFLWHSVGRQSFELFAPETNLEKKSSVSSCPSVLFFTVGCKKIPSVIFLHQDQIYNCKKQKQNLKTIHIRIDEGMDSFFQITFTSRPQYLAVPSFSQQEVKDTALTYLQPYYSNGFFGNVYLSAGQHKKVNIVKTPLP